ncbi:hypothetical protein [Leucobacter komagatae]|uniref:Uncharacterized protein n=1 Tax=Leucobacter komagatae TaxID=55969 RepID=A0A0D0IQ24_9MICO|nr:hypothetical protein [Leucobacter komagatae]KIP51578.1 hypothetical protein SD72_14630 [Leucobacter komagatae]
MGRAHRENTVSTTGRYFVGSRLFAIAARTSEAHLVRDGRPVLRALVATSRETSHLCVPAHGNVSGPAERLAPKAERLAPKVETLAQIVRRAGATLSQVLGRSTHPTAER